VSGQRRLGWGGPAAGRDERPASRKGSAAGRKGSAVGGREGIRSQPTGRAEQLAGAGRATSERRAGGPAGGLSETQAAGGGPAGWQQAGSGLSEALLRDGRIRNGFEASLATLRSYAGRGTFRRYLAEECRVESTLRPEEVLDAVERLARAWNG